MNLAPSATVIGAMLLRLPFTFAQHLDASAIDQQIQAGRSGCNFNSNLQCLLPPAPRAVIRNRPIQACQPEYALRHTHGLAQWQAEQTLDTQTELDRFVTEARTTAALSTCLAMPVHAGLSQISSEPRVFSAALYAFRFVV
jgi:hypothetical protein